jgi:diadenosine tetraphosphate (Ap4A) HIT family hydrolase
LSQVKYFQCYNENDKGGFFVGQFNPRRADRSKGAGRNILPQGARTKSTPDNSCFLCVDNIRWQQKGVQQYYHFSINDRSYNALCNPFPFGPVHLTIASAEHEPQSWREPNINNRLSKIQRIVEDLYDIAKELPTFVGFYNGVGSGATIPKHLHYHFFEVPYGQKAFPLQHAATKAEAEKRDDPNAPATALSRLLVSDSFYPVTAFRLWGDRNEVISKTVNLAEEWDSLSGEYASANIISIQERNSVAMYFIPRNRFYSRSPGMSGIVGGLEALGEFVFCTEAENQAINEQKVDFGYMWRILQAVKPPGSQQIA